MSYLATRQPAAASMQLAVDLGPCAAGEQVQRTVQAELATAQALERLGPQWRVLHSVPVGPGPTVLHHLVVGPGGVFAVRSAPLGALVVDVVHGRTTVSSHGSDAAVAEVRQQAQRVLTGLRRRFGSAVDIPAVHPVLVLTGGTPPGGAPEAVAVDRLVAALESRPPRLSADGVRHLASAAEAPLTWDAPACEHIGPDVAAQYATLPGSAGPLGRPPAGLEDRVVQGRVAASRPPQLDARGPGLRTASVLVVLLGTLSLGTVGLLSPAALVLGGWTLHHYGGWRWLNAMDACLCLVGMVMAALPLPVAVALLTSMAASGG
jgi:hypothetical protein